MTKTIDVAISFLSQDEEIAIKLYDSLKERLDIFYYAEEQPKIVATDGEDTFGEIFRDKARVVVVLYRKGWGETPMTRAERSGIKQRAIKEGYGFSIWVPLDEDKSIPAFLDPQFIWFDFNRWGNDGLSAVIEEKVKESGLNIRPETVFDKLSNFKSKAELKDAISTFHWSEDGLEFIKEADRKIESIIKETVEQFEEVTNKIRFGVDRNRNYVSVISSPFKMNFHVKQNASNTIKSDEILIDLLKGRGDHGYYEKSNFKIIRSYRFLPTLDTYQNPIWEKENNGYYTLEEIVYEALTELVDDAIEEAERRIKE